MEQMKEIQEQANNLQKLIDTPVPNVFDVMAQFPPSSTNNARAIVLKAVKDYQQCPCDRHAAVLENYGFSVDHSDRADHADEYNHNHGTEE